MFKKILILFVLCLSLVMTGIADAKGGGAAKLRYEPNVYGFITKKYPNHTNEAYYKPMEYMPVFESELEKLISEIESNPDKTYLISRLGGGLANKFGIFEKVILPNIKVLNVYENVRFLFSW